MDTGAAPNVDSRPEPFNFLSLGRRKKNGPDKKYATFNRRMLAGTVDSFFLLLAAPLFDAWFPIDTGAFQRHLPDPSDPMAGRTWLIHVLSDPAFIHSWLANMFAQLLTFCVLSGLCWHFWSATPGKMLFRIRVVDANTEQPLTDRQIAIRALGYILSGLCLFMGFFAISFDKRRQGWHDKLAGSAVIVIPWKKNSTPAST